MKKRGIENYGEADARQQNYENSLVGYNPLGIKERAKEQMRAELYRIKNEYPDLSIEGYRNKLYQWSWVEEYDDVFDDLELAVSEVIESNVKGQ